MLSLTEFKELEGNAIDPTPRGSVARAGMNSGLTDSELVSKIRERNRQRKPVYLLLLEYKNRLIQRELWVEGT